MSPLAHPLPTTQSPPPCNSFPPKIPHLSETPTTNELPFLSFLLVVQSFFLYLYLLGLLLCPLIRQSKDSTVEEHHGCGRTQLFCKLPSDRLPVLLHQLVQGGASATWQPSSGEVSHARCRFGDKPWFHNIDNKCPVTVLFCPDHNKDYFSD